MDLLKVEQLLLGRNRSGTRMPHTNIPSVTDLEGIFGFQPTPPSPENPTAARKGNLAITGKVLGWVLSMRSIQLLLSGP